MTLKGFLISLYFFFVSVSSSLTAKSPAERVVYTEGTLPLILSASHQGSVKTTTPRLPDRKAGCKLNGEETCSYGTVCGDNKDESECGIRTFKDSYTKSIRIGIEREIQRLCSNSRPYSIYSELHRVKLDPNREIKEGAQNNEAAIVAHEKYHSSIDAAKQNIGSRSLLLDLHGQTHTEQYTELGYGISRTRLNDGQFDADDSFIRRIGIKVCSQNSTCFAELIRGPNSFGSFYNQAATALGLLPAPKEYPKGFTSVPSPEIESPEEAAYFSGGYISKRHGSRDGGETDAIQIEYPKQVRFSSSRRSKAAKATARAAVRYMQTQYNLMTSCNVE